MIELVMFFIYFLIVLVYAKLMFRPCNGDYSVSKFSGDIYEPEGVLLLSMLFPVHFTGSLLWWCFRKLVS